MYFCSKRRVTPDVEPGYLREILPKQPPNQGEQWDDIFKDFENKIIPGVTFTLETLIFKLITNYRDR